MRLPDPPPRLRFEPLLPLIDVVFFLVIAFMMMSHLTSDRPFDVVLPDSAQRQPSDGVLTLFVSADGEPGFVGAMPLTGEAALDALAASRAAVCAATDCATDVPVLRIAADAGAPGAALAALLPRLAAMGFADVQLVTAGG